MRTSGFYFRSPLLSPINYSQFQTDESRAHHYDYPVPQTGTFQQPGDGGYSMELPFRGLQALPVPPAAQRAGNYDTGAPCMVTVHSDLAEEPTIGPTQTPCSSMASPTYMSTPAYMYTPSPLATSSSLASPFTPATQPAERPGTADLNGAVLSMLLDGASREDILLMVERHKFLKSSGILGAVDIMSEAPLEVLEATIHAIKPGLHPTMEPSVERKRKRPETSNEERNHHIPESQHACKGPKRENPRLCPANNFKCKVRKSRAQWRSLTELYNHYNAANHLEDHRRDDVVGLVCLLCETSAVFPEDGYALVEHMWIIHMFGQRP